MKFITFILISIFISSLTQAQSLGMQQLGSLGGEISSPNSPILTHALGAVTATVIENGGNRLDQGMFLACDISCDSLKTSIDGLLQYDQSLISAYPNPTDDLIRFKGKIQLIHRFVLYNIEGREIANAQIIDAQISLQAFPTGLYFLRVFGRNGALSMVGKVEKR